MSSSICNLHLAYCWDQMRMSLITQQCRFRARRTKKFYQKGPQSPRSLIACSCCWSLLLGLFFNSLSRNTTHCLRLGITASPQFNELSAAHLIPSALVYTKRGINQRTKYSVRVRGNLFVFHYVPFQNRAKET